MKAAALILSGLLLAAAPAMAAPREYGPYHVQVVRVIDGDTLELDILLTDHLTQRVRLRLRDVDTPELRGGQACEKKAAKAASQFVRSWVREATLTVTLFGRDRYGRELGSLHKEGTTLGDALLAAGHARKYTRGKQPEWC